MCVCVCVDFQANIFPLKAITLWDPVMHLIYSCTFHLPSTNEARETPPEALLSVLSIGFKVDNDLELITHVMWRTKGKLPKAKEDKHYFYKSDEP